MEVRTALGEAFKELSTAYAEAVALKKEVLPGAQAAFDAAGEGYRLGKFNFLDVLDAQRTLFKAKEQYIMSLAAYHRSAAEVERLVGTPIADIGRMNDKLAKRNNPNSAVRNPQSKDTGMENNKTE